jgi:hypothetical protein
MDLCRDADISYRQLDHWCTKGYLVPAGRDRNPGTGQSREFPWEMVKKARLMSCLIKLGFEVQLAEKVATFAAAGEFKLAIGHGVTLTIEPHEHKEK